MKVVKSSLVNQGYYEVDTGIAAADEDLREVQLYQNALDEMEDAIVGKGQMLCCDRIIVYNLYKKVLKHNKYFLGERVGIIEIMKDDIKYDIEGDVDFSLAPPPILFKKDMIEIEELDPNHFPITSTTSFTYAEKVNLIKKDRKNRGICKMSKYVGKNEWINNFMLDTKYVIHSNHGDTDSLYMAVLIALDDEIPVDDENETVDISDFRQIVIDSCHEMLYSKYHAKYTELDARLKDIDYLIKEGNAACRETNHKLKDNMTRSEMSKLFHQAKILKKKNAMLKRARDECRNAFAEYVFMKTAGSNFKNALASVDCPGNNDILAHIEELLNFKVIIFSYNAYHDGDDIDVIQCGSPWSRDTNIDPTKYILLEKRNQVYNNVTYDGNIWFEFDELPERLVNHVIDRCCEKMGNMFRLIPDFARLQFDRENKSPSSIEPYLIGVTFNPRTRLLTHLNAPNKLPGEWLNEEIPYDALMNFYELNDNDDWRRVLSNDWEQPFTLNGEDWLSVTHNLLSRKFPNLMQGNKSIFSLDSGTPESRCVHTATNRMAMTIDKFNSYYLNEEHETLALRAKFHDARNTRLKNILLNTNDALIVQYSKGGPPRICKGLMILRNTMKNRCYLKT